MPKGLILMTALVPTVGHQYLIDFALNYPGVDVTHVIVSSRKIEPIPGHLRVRAIERQFKQAVRSYDMELHHMTEDMPQYPEDDPEFWDKWKRAIVSYVEEDFQPDDVVFASEEYGIKLAEVLGCKFVPCDQSREVFPARGTDVRNNIRWNFGNIMPTFRQYFKKRIVLFGQESCGKTTMAKRLAEDFSTTWVPEWAREYLETVGPEITPEKMKTIEYGQYAAMKASIDADVPLIFYDTDLLSTIGYYGIFNKEPYRDFELERLFEETKGDLYIVMPDHVPFEQDILRYGGDKRESDMQYWIDLLESRGCKYIIAPTGSHEDQADLLYWKIAEWYSDEFKAVKEFKR